MSTIKQLIEQLVSGVVKNEQIYSVVCKVVSVDTATQTCDCEPINDDADIFDVRLKANLSNENGVLKIPVVGSNVIATFLNKQIAFVSAYSDVEKIEIKINDINLVVDDNGFVFNDGNLDGMVIVGELIKKLNSLEMAFNQLNTEYKTHVHPIVGALPLLPPTLPTSTPTLSATTPFLSPTLQPEIENKKVKH